MRPRCSPTVPHDPVISHNCISAPSSDADDVVDRVRRTAAVDVVLALEHLAPRNETVRSSDAARDRTARIDLGHHVLHARHAPVLRHLVVRVVRRRNLIARAGHASAARVECVAVLILCLIVVASFIWNACC